MSKKVLFVLSFALLFSTVCSAQPHIQWVFTNYQPANYTNEAGEFTGFLHDIAIEALENRMNIPVKISIYPWKRCQLLVKQGKADMFITIPTAERLQYTLTTETPIWVKKRVLYTYAGHPRMAEIQQLNGLEAIKQAGFSVVSYLGNNWSKTAVEAAGISVQYATTVEGMYKMLAQKRGDVIIEEGSLATPEIKKLRLSDSIVQTEGLGSESDFHILIGKASPYAELLPRLNAVIQEMWQDGTIARILGEYGIQHIK